MKLLLYLLLALNVSLALLGWIELRKVKVVPLFDDSAPVDTIVLLGDSETSQNSLGEQCWLLGPVSSKEDAVRIKANVSGIDYFADLVETDIAKAPGYWVYFGPLPSYDESLRQLEEFKSKSIDSFIIKKGALSGSISLGVFENIDSARRMQKIMLRKGYPTKLSEIPKTRKEFWVSVEVPAVGALSAQFDRYIESKKQGLEARQVFCK